MGSEMCIRDRQSSSGRSCTSWAGNKWTRAGELLLSLRAEGVRGGSLRPCLYVKGVQKFMSSFKRHGSRGSTACDWSVSGHRGASRDPLVRVDQDAGQVTIDMTQLLTRHHEI